MRGALRRDERVVLAVLDEHVARHHVIGEELEQQSDAGHPAALAAYARGRQLDRRGSMAFTDGIVRLFSNDFPPLRAARGLGLLALDLVPPLRHFVAKRMIWGARAW